MPVGMEPNVPRMRVFINGTWPTIMKLAWCDVKVATAGQGDMDRVWGDHM